MNKIFSKLEYFIIFSLGKLLGISYIIRYLRNPNPRITIKILKAFGAIIGDQSTIKGSLFIDNSVEDKNSTGDLSHLKLGSNCYIGDCVFFDLSNEIIMGDNVVISAGVSFVTHADCNRSRYVEKIFPRTCKKIVVKDGAWLAIKATILNGVIIGENSVIAAHTLVKDNVEEHSLYAGVPARRLKGI